MDTKVQKGTLFVISGPSGVGKGCIRQRLFKQKDINLEYSISVTTRKKRDNEVEGVDYYFTNVEDFKKKIEDNQFIEYAKFVDNYYGTLRKTVEEKLMLGKDLVLEIEVQGAEQIRKVYPDAVFIFIAPPNIKILKNRLSNRGTDDKNNISKRVYTAIKELFLMSNYDYTVMNDEIDVAVSKILTIIKAEKLKTKYIDEFIRNTIAEDLDDDIKEIQGDKSC